jgi:hypothetical protein
MAITDSTLTPSKPGRVWLVIGFSLLIYAVLGNWLVLPGYRRFLERGGSDGGVGFDLGLIWGATRTILWMLSFHLGALCLAIAALAARGDEIRAFRRWFTSGAALWIILWAIPTLPGPYVAFFAATGIAILSAIVAAFVTAMANAARDGSFFSPFKSGHWLIASFFFFALATWDMCGLGSVGGILHPTENVRSASQSLVVAQTTKLIVELAFAWGLLAIAAIPDKTVRRISGFPMPGSRV